MKTSETNGILALTGMPVNHQFHENRLNKTANRQIPPKGINFGTHVTTTPRE